MDKKLKELFKGINEQNREHIKAGRELKPMCFIVNKRDEITLIGMMFRNSDEKVMMRKTIKDFILSKSIKGYLMVFDTKMTMLDKKNPKKAVIKDTIISNLYTPKEKMVDMFSYEGKKILKNSKDIKEIMGSSKRGKNLKDCKMADNWDLWNTTEIEDDEMSKKYNEFKKQNPEFYRSVE